eukprot:scaffold87218_cov21-Tisochrysis_lutea.AAC.2
MAPLPCKVDERMGLHAWLEVSSICPCACAAHVWRQGAAHQSRLAGVYEPDSQLWVPGRIGVHGLCISLSAP